VSSLPASDPTVEPTVDPAIRVEDVWIRFRTLQEKNPTLKKAVAKRGRDRNMINALRGVSFEIPSGSVYGVIGRNGAGKTTLLRAIAGILPPTYGRVTTWGRVTPLLSLGLGFNRELTGHENILLGGLANGLEPWHIAEHYHEIVDFAELGEALHRPMRTWSSGMFGRLGFAIAAHLEPEILLIDEALSAGDASFKKRCNDKINSLCTDEHCTVVIVSHGLDVIKGLASGCVWLESGLVREQGDATEIIKAYLDNEGLHEDAAAMDDM
jgi:ABC-type polysaccharide/polyol phosphate transport system ATPase subunit